MCAVPDIPRAIKLRGFKPLGEWVAQKGNASIQDQHARKREFFIFPNAVMAIGTRQIIQRHEQRDFMARDTLCVDDPVDMAIEGRVGQNHVMLIRDVEKVALLGSVSRYIGAGNVIKAFGP